MRGDPYFNRAQARPIDTASLGPIKLNSGPCTAIMRGLVRRGHADQEIDPASIDVIVVGGTRFVRELKS